MILWINTKDRKKIEVALKKQDKIVYSKSSENEFGSQVLLNLITEILEENEQALSSGKKLKFYDLKAIEIETGPGSYTGLKVGASVANALGYSLGIPVNGKEMEVELNYA